MNRTRAASLSIVISALAFSAVPAQADARSARVAASDGRVRHAKLFPTTMAAVRPRCSRRRGKLRRVSRGFVCRRGLTDRRPTCRRGYRVRRRGAGWVCRRRKPSGAAPITPGGAPRPPAPSGNQQMLNAAFDFAKQHGDYLLGNGPPVWTYWWRVDPKQCSIVDGDTARCLIWVWRERYSFYGIERGVYRVAAYAHHVGGGAYSQNFNELDWGGPYWYVCSDDGIYSDVPDCSGPR